MEQQRYLLWLCLQKLKAEHSLSVKQKGNDNSHNGILCSYHKQLRIYKYR